MNKFTPVPGDFGQFPLSDAMVLEAVYDKYSKGISNPVIGEVGGWTGATSIIASHVTQPLNGSVYTIDWFKGSAFVSFDHLAKKYNVLEYFRMNIKDARADNVNILCMESGEAAKIVKDEFFDIFFIDADHLYESVKRDIELWVPKVKKGGVICGHDFQKHLDEYHYDLRMFWPLPQMPKNSAYPYVHPGVISAVCEAFKKEDIQCGSNIWWVEL